LQRPGSYGVSSGIVPSLVSRFGGAVGMSIFPLPTSRNSVSSICRWLSFNPSSLRLHSSDIPPSSAFAWILATICSRNSGIMASDFVSADLLPSRAIVRALSAVNLITTHLPFGLPRQSWTTNATTASRSCREQNEPSRHRARRSPRRDGTNGQTQTCQPSCCR